MLKNTESPSTLLLAVAMLALPMSAPLVAATIVNEDAKLLAGDGAAGDQLGSSLVVSGSTIIVGAIGDGSAAGSAYVFEEPAGGWTGVGNHGAKLLASDGVALDLLGFSAAVSGSTVVVAARNDDGHGSVYVFEKPAGGWTGTINESAKLVPGDGVENDEFGTSVAISGTTVVVGSKLDDDHGSQSGSAYLFVEPVGGWTGTLNQNAKLLASDGAAGDRFGGSVAVSGTIVAIGAYGDDGPGGDARGAVYVFEEPAGGWTGTLNQQARLLASGGVAGDWFGYSIAVSDTTVVVGAKNDSASGFQAGAAYVFEEPLGGWTGTLNQNAKLLASDGAAGDYLGWSIAVSGSIVVAGAQGSDGSGSGSGSAYVFEEPSGGWAGSLNEQAKLVAGDAAVGDTFGYSIGVSGTLVVVGAQNDDQEPVYNSGSAYVFDFSVPTLSIATTIPAAELEAVAVDLDLDTAGESVAATTFSVDYDQNCLSFDDTDGDADNIPDDMSFSVPASFSVTAFHDLGDADGEIDVSVADLAPPIATLPDDTVVTITFTSTCSPSTGDTIIAPVSFSSDPSATFSDDLAVDIDGSTVDGSVEIWPGPRGDCNGNGLITAADLIGDALEIFDGDGTFWADVVGGTFVGSPVGCDANDDTAVDAGDISCTIVLIFNGTCGGSPFTDPGSIKALDPRTSPLLGLRGARYDQDGRLWIPVVFSPGAHAISSVAFSLDLAKGVAFDPFDGDGDGIPDAVRFPKGRPGLVDVRYDASDHGGELDVALAEFDGVLGDGLLLEFAVQPLWSDSWSSVSSTLVRFADTPAASFGNLLGQAVPGQTIYAAGGK